MDCRRKILGNSNHFFLFLTFGLLVCLSFSVTFAKRFDCRMFCKETGFHGMIGGCRCSFTLFTTKRAIRDPYEDLAKLSLGLHGIPKFDHGADRKNSLENEIGSKRVDESSNNETDLRPNLGLMKFLRIDPENSHEFNSGEPSFRNSLIYPVLINRKRLEMEQDMDNGETADYLRLPY
ncbi:UNVERIFIED_CONTAM: hypothetical protein RMT77_005189 [Armadillidium vulgare]